MGDKSDVSQIRDSWLAPTNVGSWGGAGLGSAGGGDSKLSRDWVVSRERSSVTRLRRGRRAPEPVCRRVNHRSCTLERAGGRPLVTGRLGRRVASCGLNGG